MPAGPIPLSVIEQEFGEDKEAWTIQDLKSKNYVIVPDSRFPGRRPIRFFLRESDAQALINELKASNERLRGAKLRPVNVKLLQSLRGIVTDTNPESADAFVVHSPNEVFEWLRGQ